MPFVFYIFLLLCDLLSGYGILTIFHIRLKAAFMITLSLLLGVAVASFVPFLMELLFIPLTASTIFIALLLVALALNTPTFRKIRRDGWPLASRSFKPASFRLQPYELPFMAIFVFMALVSIWRCYYLPPTSRDVLSGPEAIAQFAVSEHTMINSFFNVDLWSTNNQFKSPFLISLQLIYKLAGFQFGQLWLSIVFVSFMVFLYHAIKEKQHPVIAGLILLLVFMTPEIYAYTFMILYDYSNMVYFFLSLYFLFGYFRNKSGSWLGLSGLLMGIATYIRSETVVLAVLFLPAILFMQRRERMPKKKMALAELSFFLPSLLLYYLSGPLWLRHYLPVHYDVGGLINKHPTDLGPLFQRYSDIITRLIGSQFGVHLWGYFFFIAGVFFVAEFAARDRFNKDARNWLYGILVLYLGIGALGFLLPLIDLNDSTKRELFKLFPLMALYLANSAWLLRLSDWIKRWEERTADAAVAGKPGSAAVAVAGRSGKMAAAAHAGKPGAAGAGKSGGKSSPGTGKTGKKRRK